MQSVKRDGRASRFALGLLLVLATSLSGWSQQSAASQSEPHDRPIENWSSLSLAGSEFKLRKPTPGEKDDLPGFTRELIQAQWRDGDPVDLYIIRPKFVPKPSVVLYLYSYPSETDRFRDNDYCARITSGGVAAVGFVSALTGQRYSMRPMKEWFVSELQEALGSSVHDVQMILNFLSTRGDLDVSNVGMFGTGSGGSIAILSAAADSRIKAIDVLNPWGAWPDWMAKSAIIPENERPNYLKPEFLKGVAPLDPVQWLPQLKSQRIRIQTLADDTVTPKTVRERLESVAPATATILHFGNTQEFYRATAAGRLFQWVKDQLRLAPVSDPGVENTRTLQPAGQMAEQHND